MKRKGLFLLAVFALCVALFPVAAAANEMTQEEAESKFKATVSGEGTKEKPYMISDLEGLEAFCKYINTGNVSEGKFFQLAKNAQIDMKDVYYNDDDMPAGQKFGLSWEPIGIAAYPFKGIFDGNNQTINNLYISASNAQFAVHGLFGCVEKPAEGEGGVVKNLIVNGTIVYNGSSSNDTVGAVVGENKGGTVENCENYCAIKSNQATTGGIVGRNIGGKVTNCNNHGEIVNSGSTQNVGGGSSSVNQTNTGGVVGHNTGTVYSCSNAADGVVNSGMYGGGVVGRNEVDGEVTSCKNSGTVKRSDNYTGASTDVGGVVGYNYGKVKYCENEKSGKVLNDNGNASRYGGVVGQNFGSVADCNNNGAVTMDYDSSASSITTIGGVVGQNYATTSGPATVSGCNNYGTVKGYAEVGGVVGRNYASYSDTRVVEVSGCSNSGAVNGAGDGVGGVVGYNSANIVAGTATVSNCNNTAGGTVKNTGGRNTGGVVGLSEADPGTVTVSGCKNAAAVEGGNYTGGIVGRNYSGTTLLSTATVSGCENIGLVSSAGDGLGGIVGYNYSGMGAATVFDCRNTGGGVVKGKGERVGGVVGFNSVDDTHTGSTAKVEKCFNTCAVSTTLEKVSNNPVDQDYRGGIGGVAGVNYARYDAATGGVTGEVTNCYNTGNVSIDLAGEPDFMQDSGAVGGVVGMNYSNGGTKVTNESATALAAVRNCYSTGEVKSADNYTGAVVGYNLAYKSVVSIENCYYSIAADIKGLGGSKTTGSPTGQEKYADMTAKTAAVFASGEVAWLLQNPKKVNGDYAAQPGDSAVWGQALRAAGAARAAAEPSPVLDGEEVFQIELHYLWPEMEGGPDQMDYTNAATADDPYEPKGVERVIDGESHIPQWYTKYTPGVGGAEDEFNEEDEFKGVVTGDMELYAKWVKGTLPKPEPEPTDPVDPPPPTPTPPTPPSPGFGELWNPLPSGSNDNNGQCMCRSTPEGCDCYCCCTKDDTCPMWDFRDLNRQAWYHDGVHFALVDGLMVGYGGGIFQPNTDISRAMIATILYRLEGEPYVDDSNLVFTDVEAGAWYLKGVLWAESAGVVEGYGNGKMGPNDPITREQLAAMLWRYARYRGHDMSAGASLSRYSDASEVSAWAVDALEWAVDVGIIEGMSETTLSPGGTATRAQASTMLMRYCTLLGEGPVCTQGPCHLSAGRAS